MLNHRQIYHQAWSQLTPPLRPHPDVVAGVKEQIKMRSRRALLLGVTPELADVAADLVALDRNFSMVQNVWPGNTSSRYAVVGDWRNTNFKSASFSCCIGDGSLCGLSYPTELEALFSALVGTLEPGARIVCRLYLPRATPETITDLKDQALAGAIGNFHAFKMRLAMALAAKRPFAQVPVETILNTFDMMFTNRDEIAELTGWPRAQIDTIDYYRESTVLFNFPGQDRLLSLVHTTCPNPRLVACGSYEMAERCPLLVADTR